MPAPTLAQDLPAESPRQVCNLCPGRRLLCERRALLERAARRTELLCRPRHSELTAASFSEEGEEIL